MELDSVAVYTPNTRIATSVNKATHAVLC